MLIENLRKSLLVTNVREGGVLQTITNFITKYADPESDVKIVCPAIFERSGSVLEDLVITDEAGSKFAIGIDFSVPKGFGFESLSVFNNDDPNTSVPQIIQTLDIEGDHTVLLKSDIRFEDSVQEKTVLKLTRILQEISSQDLSEIEDTEGLLEWYRADIAGRVEKIIDSYKGNMDRMNLPALNIIDYLAGITINDLCLGVTYPNVLHSEGMSTNINHVAGIRVTLKHSYTYLINGEKVVIDPFEGMYMEEKLRFNTNLEQLIKHNCYSRFHGATLPPMVSLKPQDI